MGVILQAWYRAEKGQVVPAPYDKETPDVRWWWDHLALQAPALRRAGFSTILTPPVCKTNAGAFAGADGYGVFDEYDIGSKEQFYSRATRYGTREQLTRMAAVMKSVGMDVFVDTVPHQRSGGRNGFYNYLGSDGKTLNGRFPKHPSCFISDPPKPPRVARDLIAGPVQFDYAFGDEFSYYNSTPPDYVASNVLAASDWLTRAVDAKGYRFDDCKGLSAGFAERFCTSLSMKNNITIGEYYDGNPDNLNYYVWQQLHGHMYLFDFTTHFMVMGMCNNTSNWNMGQLKWHKTLASTSPYQAVTFVENADTDVEGYSTVIWNKAQGYFWILTSLGWPCIYYKDWSKDRGCYGIGLQEHINNYIWIHENLANGDLVFRYTDFQVACYERVGQPGLLCAINNDMYGGWKHINVQTNFGPNVQLHDYTGHVEDQWTDWNGRVDLYLPPNINGLGTVAFSKVGLEKPFQNTPRYTVQSIEGADDLDLQPALDAKTVDVTSVHMAAGSHCSAAVTVDAADLGTGTLVFSFIDKGGNIVSSNPMTGMARLIISFFVKQTDDYILRVEASGLPAKSCPFRVDVNYLSTVQGI
jgi:alpha-amylase